MSERRAKLDNGKGKGAAVAWLHRSHADDGVDVITMKPDEYRAAVDRALSELGLTYTELASQAATRRFSSNDAADLWPMIRGSFAADGQRP
jgi:hypothetical protein